MLMTMATVDRLVDRAEVLVTDGQDGYRLGPATAGQRGVAYLTRLKILTVGGLVAAGGGKMAASGEK
jgi:hypothetical protein